MNSLRPNWQKVFINYCHGYALVFAREQSRQAIFLKLRKQAQ
jgi:hypothetical protein